MMISQMIARGIYFLFMLVEQEKYTHILSVTALAENVTFTEREMTFNTCGMRTIRLRFTNLLKSKCYTECKSFIVQPH